MPIVTLQRQFRELGRIRLGEKGPKGQPKRLGTWRLTSPDRSLLDAAAAEYQGEVVAWPDAPDGDEWQLITMTDSLDIVVPPGQPLTQWNELWSGAGCQRRCDGQREWLRDVPCLCPPDPEERNELAKNGQACKPTSRLQVILPKLPDLGTWLYVSHGYYAAVELAGTADLLAAAAANGGSMIRASLWIDQRTVKRPGQTTRHFPVPAIRIHETMTTLLAGGNGGPALVGSRVPAQLTTSAPLPTETAFDQPVEASTNPDPGPPAGTVPGAPAGCTHPPDRHQASAAGVTCTQCGSLLAQRAQPPAPVRAGAGEEEARASSPTTQPAASSSPPGAVPPAPITLDEATVRVGNLAIARRLVRADSPTFWDDFDAVMASAGVERPPLENRSEAVAEWNALAERIELGEFEAAADDPAGVCSEHNAPWKWVAPGTNKAGKAYNGFFCCSGDRDCKARPTDAWRKAHKPVVVTP